MTGSINPLYTANFTRVLVTAQMSDGRLPSGKQGRKVGDSSRGPIGSMVPYVYLHLPKLTKGRYIYKTWILWETLKKSEIS